MYIIIVLGNSTEKIWKKRVEKGVDFYNEIKKSFDDDLNSRIKIVFTGTEKNSVDMKNYAIDTLKINESDVILENHSKSTYENIVFTRNILENAGYFKSTFMTSYNFVVCTSQFHIARATLIALDQLGNYGKVSSIYSIDEHLPDDKYRKEKEFTYHYVTNCILPKSLL